MTNAFGKMLYRFPKIDASHLKITSPQTYAYNCVGWAANDDNRVWWPHSSVYWPDTAPLTETVDAFVKAFQSIGFIDCDSGDLDSGFEKIVIYATHNGVPKHVARQLPNGKWTSKIGHFEDIEHGTPDCLSSDAYGSPVRFMKRPIQKG